MWCETQAWLGPLRVARMWQTVREASRMSEPPPFKQDGLEMKRFWRFSQKAKLGLESEVVAQLGR